MNFLEPLDDFLLRQIMYYLDVQSLQQFVFTNKSSYASQSLWRLICAKKANVSYEAIPHKADYRPICKGLRTRRKMEHQSEDADKEVAFHTYEIKRFSVWSPCGAICFQEPFVKIDEIGPPLNRFDLLCQSDGTYDFVNVRSAYYEVTILTEDVSPDFNETTISIGFCIQKEGDINLFPFIRRHPGWDPESFALHSDDGSFFYGDEYRYNDVLPDIPLMQGSVMGLGIDIHERIVFATLNGERVAECPLGFNHSANIFAVVGMDEKTKCHVNFGESPFVYDIRCEKYVPANYFIDPGTRRIISRQTGEKNKFVSRYWFIDTDSEPSSDSE